jgi:predicted RNA-binding protein with PUA-like domain
MRYAGSVSSWLLKTEPSTYSFADLVKEKRTRWDGISNPVALKHARAMQKGDRVFIYHTGGERRAVGVAEVVAAGDAPELKAVAALPQPVGLDEIKAAALFKDSPLVKIGRLSVVPLDEKQAAFIVQRGKFE